MIRKIIFFCFLRKALFNHPIITKVNIFQNMARQLISQCVANDEILYNFFSDQTLNKLKSIKDYRSMA